MEKRNIRVLMLSCLFTYFLRRTKIPNLYILAFDPPPPPIINVSLPLTATRKP